MPFKTGQSGNPKGRPKGSDRLFREALDVAIKRVDGEKTKLAQIAEALVEKAIGGDVPAINVVADRLDGKPTQIIGSDPDNPFTVMHEAGISLDAKLDRLIAGRTRKA